MTLIEQMISETNLTKENFICYCGGNLKIRTDKHMLDQPIEGRLHCECEKCKVEANHTFTYNKKLLKG